MANELLTTPAAISRPASALSSRPISRASVYPGGRGPARTRPSTRHNQHIHELVTQILGSEASVISAQVDQIANTLDSAKYSAPTLEIRDIDKRIEGLSERHAVHLDDELSESLKHSWANLKAHVSETSDRVSQVNMRNLPDVMQLLLSLSSAPEESTHAHARSYLHRLQYPDGEPEDTLTWAQILAEEPFEGQHWEGAASFGLPIGATKEGYEIRVAYDSDSGSDFTDFEVARRERRSNPPPVAESDSETSLEDDDERARLALGARIVVEEFEDEKYWDLKPRVLAANVPTSMDLRDQNALASNVLRALRGEPETHPLLQSSISETDAVREVLFMLQGNGSILVSSSSNDGAPLVEVKDPLPSIPHFSPATFRSLIMHFATHASTLAHLRSFVEAIYNASYSFASSSTSTTRSSSSKTLEAFAAAVDSEIRRFDTWCASQEERFLQARSGKAFDEPVVCTLLALEHDVENATGGEFDALLGLVRKLELLHAVPDSSPPVSGVAPLPLQPAILATEIINSLLDAVQSERLKGLDDESGSTRALMRVFVQTVEPMWAAVGAWMKHGIDFFDVGSGTTAPSLDSELFIEREDDIPTGTTDFWAEGHTVRTYSDYEASLIRQSTTSLHEDLTSSYSGGLAVVAGSRAVPHIFAGIADAILSAGKSVGLLRVLQVEDFFGGRHNADDEDGHRWMDGWSSFAELVGSFQAKSDIDAEDGDDAHSDPPRSTSSRHMPLVSREELASLLQERIEPWCRLAHARLNRVIDDDCELWYHQAAVEGLYFMRQGDTMGRFCEALFDRFRDARPWSDYHALNSLFRDTTSSTGSAWFDHRLVRLTHRGARGRDPTRSVRTLDGLSLEYQVPFPLTFLFDPPCIKTHSAIFTFLLQLRFAKSVLDRMFIDDGDGRHSKDHTAGCSKDEYTTICAIRARLMWFINTLMFHISTNVIELSLGRLYESLAKASSLDEMIVLYQTLMGSLARMCLVSDETSSIRRGVLSILDSALRLNAVYTASMAHNTPQTAAAVASPLFLASIQNRLAPTGTRRRKRINRSQRQRRRNVIGFSSEPHDDGGDREDDDDEVAQEEEAEILRESFQGGEHEGTEVDADASENASPSRPRQDESTWMHSSTQLSTFFLDAPVSEQLERIGRELDVMVRYVMKQVESVSGGGSRPTTVKPAHEQLDGLEADAFSMLTFAFEDWDL